MQTQKSKIGTGKEIDTYLVVTESSGTESEVQDDNSRSGNDTDADDVNFRPIYDEEPMVEVQLTAECNIFAIGQHHTEQPEIINEGHKFSPNKTSAMYENTSPGFDLRWKPTGKIFKFVGLRWIPTGKLFDSYTSKVDSYGSNVDISKIHECKQTLDLSAELESLFDPLLDEYFNGENQVVSKSSAVTTNDASDKSQQQPDSTSSTPTLATSVTAAGNFDL
nr:hypothetical protein [Tanacetum cinerariifolium]